MTVLTIDELNKLGKSRRSVPYDTFFGEMVLTDKQKAERKSFAEQMEDAMLFLFALVVAMEESGSIDTGYLESTMRDKYAEIAAFYVTLDSQYESYIDQFAHDVVKTTLERSGIETAKDSANGNAPNNGSERAESAQNNPDAYYLSEDRAVLVAENEANTTLNHGDYTEAKRQGKTYKVWRDFGDFRVRQTHREVNGIEIPIGEAFAVGNSLMMYPRDSSLGADGDEIAGCRCTCEYY